MGEQKRVTCDLTVSVDGYVAGAGQSLEHPMGRGTERLHRWQLEPTEADRAIIEAWQGGVGAYVMGRNMFTPGRGGWDLDWTGWWGPEPPYAAPVFVLTHHPRESLVLGATTFHFVTDGIESALGQAQEAAGDRPVSIAGGASTANQYLAAGLVDQLHLHVSPLLVGAGERLFDGVPPGLSLEPVQVVSSPSVTHIKYSVTR